MLLPQPIEEEALKLLHEHGLEVIQAAEMRKVIKHDNYKGKRGLFVTLVHKFRPNEFIQLEKEIREISAKQETLKTRKNVLAFIDEGHRTQYGQLAAQMKSILGEDTTYYFAFTGTPISKPEKGIDTYGEFSYLPEEKYLDKHFITESIKDDFTKKIAYKPALEKGEGVHLKKEMLDSFLKQKYQEIPENLRDVVEDGIKKKLSIIKIYLEKIERIRMVAEHIKNHFVDNLDGMRKSGVLL